MITKMFRLGAAAALLVVGAARAEDADRTPSEDRRQDAPRAAMHDAMQKQMGMPQAPAQMPGMPERAAADATRAREHGAQVQQVREAARQRAMAHGARDAAKARGDGATHGGPQNGTMHGGGMMGGDANTTQQGAGMMRTGDMHGGSGGMMPGGGMGSGTGMGGGGMMGVAPTSGTTAGTPSK